MLYEQLKIFRMMIILTEMSAVLEFVLMELERGILERDTLILALWGHREVNFYAKCYLMNS